MKINPSLLLRLRKISKKSPSAYRIGGIAISKKGNILGTATNGFRNENIEPERGSGKHCEAELIRKYGMKISTIIIMRLGKGGDVLKIDPCSSCQKLADKYGIKIISV